MNMWMKKAALACLGAAVMALSVPAAAEEMTEGAGDLTKDPSGNEILLPDQVERIVSMSPSSTQFLLDLGLAEAIVACDTYSAADYGDALKKDIPAFDMMTPDNEQLTALEPDLVITTGMSSSGGTDVFASVKEAGICVVDIPSGSSLGEVEDNLLFIGEAVGRQEEAEKIVSDMRDFVDQMKQIGESIPLEDRQRVLYEISTPTPDNPSLYTAGGPTYITEIIEAVGAENVAGDLEEAWVSVSEEEAIAMDPDVILTTDTYTENVVDVLKRLSGWENVSAVVNGRIYALDPNAINRPNQHLTGAMLEIGQNIYPEAFAQMEDPFAQ